MTITTPDVQEPDSSEPDADTSEAESDTEREAEAEREACAWWRRRLVRLTAAWHGVRSERDIAMYRLYQHGRSIAAIARLADETPDTVRDIILSAARDDNMAYYPPGPIWIEFWPSYDPAPATCYPMPGDD